MDTKHQLEEKGGHDELATIAIAWVIELYPFHSSHRVLIALPPSSRDQVSTNLDEEFLGVLLFNWILL